MPIIASAKKALRQNKTKNARNTHFKKMYSEVYNLLLINS